MKLKGTIFHGDNKKTVRKIVLLCKIVLFIEVMVL